MDPVAILATATTALGLISKAIDLGMDVAPNIKNLYNTLFKGTQVTQADLDAIAADNDALSALIEQPIPAEDP